MNAVKFKYREMLEVVNVQIDKPLSTSIYPEDLKHIQQLILEEFHMDDLEFLCHCEQLQVLELVNMDPGFKEVKDIPPLPKLRELYGSFTGIDYKLLAKQCPNLETLAILEKAPLDLVQLRSLRNLQELTLNSTPIHLSDPETKLGSLAHITLIGISCHTFPFWAFPNIHSLIITDCGLVNMMDLPDYKSLKKLEISGNVVNFDIIARMPQLKHLHVNIMKEGEGNQSVQNQFLSEGDENIDLDAPF